MTADGLEIRPAGTAPEQLAAYAQLLSKVFGAAPKFTAQSVAWRYRDNPAGAVVGADAWAGETLAAHYVTCPLWAHVDGQRVHGLLSMNTATHPDFQGKGLFTRLAQATYEQGRSGGYGFVIGVANGNSTPGFLRRLAFQHVGSLRAGILPRAPRRFTAAAVQYQADWSPALIGWRLANPATRYRVGHSGALTGVWAPTHLPMVRCAAFLETEDDLAPGRGRPLGPALFLGLEPRIDLASLGFVPLPERFRASPLNLIWRALGDGAPAHLHPDRAVINFLDFDPY